MPTGDDVVYRDKALAPRWLLALGALAVLGVAAAIPFTALPWWASLAVLGAGGAGLLGNLLLWIIRTTVTTTKLVVHYGFLREEIPLDSIEECSAEDLPLIRRYSVGWGLGLGGSYFTLGTKRGVRVRFRGKLGLVRTLWLSAEDPEALAKAVSLARSGKVRIEDVEQRLRVDASTSEELEAASDERPNAGERSRERA